MPELDAPTLSTVAAARLAGVTPRTFRRWLKRNPLPAQVVYGPNGAEHRYTFAGVDALVRKMRGQGVSVGAQVEEPTSSVRTAHGDTDTAATRDEDGGQGGTLARPFVEVLRPFVEEVGALREEVRQLREVLVNLRLPAPASSTPATAPRVRWRAVAEVSLLGVVAVLAGAMVAAVARIMQINGAIVLPW